jgi:hypothetical protein
VKLTDITAPRDPRESGIDSRRSRSRGGGDAATPAERGHGRINRRSTSTTRTDFRVWGRREPADGGLQVLVSPVVAHVVVVEAELINRLPRPLFARNQGRFRTRRICQRSEDHLFWTVMAMGSLLSVADSSSDYYVPAPDSENSPVSCTNCLRHGVSGRPSERDPLWHAGCSIPPNGPGSPRPASGVAPPAERARICLHAATGGCQQRLIRIAPEPVLAGLNRPDDLMHGRVFSGVAAGVLVLGRVTAQHFPVRHAHPQVNPRVTERQARLAARGRGPDIPDLVQVTTRPPR